MVSRRGGEAAAWQAPGAGARMCQGGIKQEASGQILNGLEGLAKEPHFIPQGEQEPADGF